jgi:hypothetical protein
MDTNNPIPLDMDSELAWKTSNDERRSDFVLIILFIATSLVSWLLSFGLSLALGPSNDEWMIGLILGLAFGHISLLSFWIVHSTVNRLPRFFLAFMGAFVVFILSSIFMHRNARGSLDPSITLMHGLSIVVQLIFFSLPQVFWKWKKRLRLKRADSRLSASQEPHSQFAIRDLLLATAIIAVSLILLQYLSRFSPPMNRGGGELIRLTIVFSMIIGFHLLVATPLFLTLLSRSLRIWTVISAIGFLIVTTIVEHSILTAVLGPGGGYLLVFGLNVPSFLIVAVMLLITRSFGYRLGKSHNLVDADKAEGNPIFL